MKRSNALIKRLCQAVLGSLLFVLFANHALSQQWNTNGTNISNANSGNVGIGTSVPAYKLDVTPNFRLNSDGTGNVTNWYPSVTSSGTNYYKALDIFAYQLPIAASVTESGYRIGLGIQGFASDTNFAGTLAYQFGIWARHGSYTAASGSRINNSYGVFIDSLTTPNTTIDNLYGLYQASSEAKNYFGGNVGIGTASPGSKLDVNGVIRNSAANGFSIGNDAGQNRLQTSGSTFQFLTSSNGAATAQVGALAVTGSYANTPPTNGLYVEGNVDVGTTSQNYKLNVGGSGISSVGSGTVGAAVNITNTDKTAPDTANYWNIYNMTGGYGNKLSFWAYAATNACAGGLCRNMLDIYDNGVVSVPLNLGVGTNQPGSNTLKVVGPTNITGNLTVTANGAGTGNIVADGSIAAKYQDVAEWVPSSDQLSAGTVVVLDSTKSNQVTSSTVSYDTRVAGVVSEQPGLALGEKGDSKVLVATTGRVRVKVDASKGPIHIGDLLVTSDVPGVAMKSEPVEFAGRKMHMPGTLIGKALEPLEKGKGAILVLLSLQ